MVNTDKLTYESIIDALLKGDFYSSQKPEIYELYVEDDKVTVKCSPAKKISYSTFGRRHSSVLAEPGTTVTEATFQIKESDIFFRLDIMDSEGLRADTQAYYLKDLKIFE